MAKYSELVDAMTRADMAGDEKSAAVFAEMLRNKEYEKESSKTEAVLQAVGQGGTFNMADEIGAGVRTGFDALVGKRLMPAAYALMQKMSPYKGNENRSFGDLYDEHQKEFYDGSLGQMYDQNLASQRDALDAAEREHPGLMLGTELATGLLQGGAGVARAAAGRALGSGLLRGAGAGAAYGAAGGYGASEYDPIATATRAAGGGTPRKSVGEAAYGAGIDAGFGAAAGGVLGVAIPSVAKAAQQAAKLASAYFTRNQRLTEAGRQKIARSLLEDLQSGKMTLEQAQRELDSNPDMMAADLGPAMREAADTLVTSSTPGGRTLETALRNRAAGNYDRVMTHISRALGGNGEPSKFADVSEKIVADLETASKPLYEAAHFRRFRVTPEMQALLETPTGRAGMQRANVIAADLRRKVPALGSAGKIASSEMADYVLRGMDAHVSSVFKTDPGMGHNAKIVRDRFRELLFEANPDLKAARKVWSDGKSVQDAMDAGLRVFNDDADAVALSLRDRSQGEIAAYKIGVMRAVERRVGNKFDDQNISRDLEARRNVREALRVAFGDEDTYLAFRKTLQAEQAMHETFSKATRNSATARRLAAAAAQDVPDSTAAGMAAYLLAQGTGGFAPALIARGTRQIYNKMFGNAVAKRAENLSGSQANMLMTRNLQNIMRPNTLYGLLGTGVPQSGAFMAGTAAQNAPGLLGR